MQNSRHNSLAQEHEEMCNFEKIPPQFENLDSNYGHIIVYEAWD